VIAVARARN